MSVRFFLGANSAHGFFSHYDQLLPDGFTRILKGGPGCGKSTLMKRVAAEGERMGLRTERISCSSDPDSLDGIAFPDVGYAIVDGTAPHTVEPTLCGARALYLDLGRGYRASLLRERRGELLALQAEEARPRRRAARLLAALGALEPDGDAFPEAEVSACRAMIPGGGTEPGRCRSVFFSGFTPRGVLTYRESYHALCDRLVVLRGSSGGCSAALRSVQSAAASSGWDVLLGDDPLLPGARTDAVLIPSLRLGFLAETPLRTLPLRADAYFGLLPQEELAPLRETLIGEITASLREACELHGALERAFAPCTDFSEAERAAALCCEELCELAEKKSAGGDPRRE